MEKHKDIYAIIGENIAMYRKNNGMNMNELAKKSGISISFLGNIEKGTRKPTLHTLQRIAAALDIGIISFFSSRTKHGNMTEDSGIIFSIMKILSDKTTDEKRRILGIMKLL